MCRVSLNYRENFLGCACVSVSEWEKCCFCDSTMMSADKTNSGVMATYSKKIKMLLLAQGRFKLNCCL